jgi:hypothetical protein
MMGLIEQEPQVRAFNINHDRFLFPVLTVLIFIKIQIAVLGKAGLSFSSIFPKGQIIKYINLRWYLPTI